jgi:hypothetical protein
LAVAIAVTAVLPSAGDADAHSVQRLAFPVISHADPRSIDREPELPAPRANSTGQPLSDAARAAATPLNVLQALPVLWCGTKRSSDDTANQLENGSYRYHAIYAVPSGAVDRFGAVAGTLQADAFQASALLERLYRRSIRLDMGTACGRQYLDISVVGLPRTAAALTALANKDSNALLNQVSGDLAAAGFDPLPESTTVSVAAAKQSNYLVWLEGVTARPGVCGVGGQYADDRRDFSNINNYGGKLALVMRDGDGFCNSNTVRHEIGHNLGALLPGAPHAFDGAHCDDAYEDTMCYPQARSRGAGGYQGQFFDFGNDDYWDPQGGALPWWTVNLSRFLCPNIVCNVPSDQSAVGTLAGTLGGLADPRDLLTSCPLGTILGVDLTCKANSVPGAGVARRAAPRPALVFSARRSGKGRWRVSMRVQDATRAVVTLRCRRGGRQIRALRRRISSRRTTRATVRCDTRPRASAVLA